MPDAFRILSDTTLQLFARGGGGGSSSGSGGGGGLIVLLGYLPTHFVGSQLRKKMPGTVGTVLMFALSFLYGALWWYFGIFGILVSLGAFLGGPVGYYNLLGKASRFVRKKAADQLSVAASKDPAWDQNALTDYVRQVFQAFQYDWSTNDTVRIQQYLSPRFAYHTQLILYALKLRSRRNVVENAQIIELFPIAVNDALDDSQDAVTFYISAQAHDRLVETIDGIEQEVFVDDSVFHEYWRFVRAGTTWKLDGIEQVTAEASLVRAPIESFAREQGMYFSPDWGWLLLPRHGQLFGVARFGTSDINNHVVGVYNNILVELYTYVPKPSTSNSDASQYLIAQVALPKRYGSIIVEAKSGVVQSLFRKTPKGYNRLNLEWPDFNKRYSVCATDVEQVSAFELLHPVFMEKLFALPFTISIEVVDNVVYLYTKDKSADYATMYSILRDAFKEMRL